MGDTSRYRACRFDAVKGRCARGGPKDPYPYPYPYPCPYPYPYPYALPRTRRRCWRRLTWSC